MPVREPAPAAGLVMPAREPAPAAGLVMPAREPALAASVVMPVWEPAPPPATMMLSEPALAAFVVMPVSEPALAACWVMPAWEPVLAASPVMPRWEPALSAALVLPWREALVLVSRVKGLQQPGLPASAPMLHAVLLRGRMLPVFGGLLAPFATGLFCPGLAEPCPPLALPPALLAVGHCHHQAVARVGLGLAGGLAREVPPQLTHAR